MTSLTTLANIGNTSESNLFDFNKLESAIRFRDRTTGMSVVLIDDFYIVTTNRVASRLVKAGYSQP